MMPFGQRKIESASWKNGARNSNQYDIGGSISGGHITSQKPVTTVPHKMGTVLGRALVCHCDDNSRSGNHDIHRCTRICSIAYKFWNRYWATYILLLQTVFCCFLLLGSLAE